MEKTDFLEEYERLTGAEIVIECLHEQGVDKVFGFPGGAVIPIYDALYDGKHNITHFRTCHEQGAVHAADGYARTTGKVGVCIVTSGPGATNTITGIATAYMDSVPIVVITGQVSRALIGKDSFQEVDITAMTLTITKHCEMVTSVEKLPGVLRRAFEIARSGRPGPVLVDIPKDIMMQMDAYKSVPTETQKSRKQMPGFDCEGFDAALKALAQAQNPHILAGGGVILSDASEQLTAFAEKRQIPVANTLMGSGAFPQSHPLALGMVGMHGSRRANEALMKADVILAVGVRFSDRLIGAVEKFCPSAKIIQIDIDINEVGKNKDVMYPVVGDLGDMLHRFDVALGHKTWRTDFSHSNAHAHDELKLNTAKTQSLMAADVLGAIKRAFGEKAIVVTEVGQHQMWTAQHYGFERPRTFITSGGLGTMGFGLGAAIGAQVGNPEKTIIHIAGDGSFKMNAIELGTVSKYGLPLKTFVFNNNALGMVRQWQRLFCNGRFSETDGDDSVDFVKLAAAYGIEGFRVRTVTELESVLERIKGMRRPVLVDCIIDHDDDVYPIVPPGKGLAEMLG